MLYLLALGILIAYWQFHNSAEGGVITYVKDNPFTAAFAVVATIVGVFFHDILAAFIGPAIAMAITGYLGGSLADKLAKAIQWIKDLFTA